MAQADNDNKTLLRRRMELAVEQLIDALDAIDASAEDAEETDEDGPGEDLEPSLGSFDRITNQGDAWRQGSGGWHAFEVDAEKDDCDKEDSDPAEDSDTGIGDVGGLREQMGGAH